MVYHSVYIKFQKRKRIQKTDQFLLGEVGDGREIRVISITKGMGNRFNECVYSLDSSDGRICVYTHTHTYIGKHKIIY